MSEAEESPPRSGLEQLMHMSRDFTAGLADLFFPRDCIVTSQPVEGGAYQYLSQEAQQGIYHAKAPQCTQCGYPFFGDMVSSRECPYCKELEPVYDQGRTLLLARDGGRALIHELKYYGGRYVLQDIRTLLKQRPDFLEFITGATLVPVPLHPKRERKRRYNQSLLLAQCMAKAADGLVVTPLLSRTQDTASQTRLNRKQRYENVKNAFALRKGAVLHSERRYIIVDDVFTTGATVNACASVLRQSGAKHLDVATLAHG